MKVISTATRGTIRAIGFALIILISGFAYERAMKEFNEIKRRLDESEERLNRTKEVIGEILQMQVKVHDAHNNLVHLVNKNDGAASWTKAECADLKIKLNSLRDYAEGIDESLDHLISGQTTPVSFSLEQLQRKKALW
jgi:hypothetical protein